MISIAHSGGQLDSHGLTSKGRVNFKRHSVWVSRGAENIGIHPRSAAGTEVRAGVPRLQEAGCLSWDFYL